MRKISKINENVILVVYEIYAFLIDLTKGELISRFAHTAGIAPSKSDKIARGDNFYTWDCGDALIIFKVEKDINGKEVFKGMTSIPFSEHFPNILPSPLLRAYSIVKLHSGNYLYVSQKDFKQENRRPETSEEGQQQDNRGRVLARALTIEICPRNFAVLQTRVLSRQQSGTINYIHFSEIYQTAQDLLIAIPGRNKGLVLFNPKLEILSELTQYNFCEESPIKTIDGFFVIGRKNTNRAQGNAGFFLFEVDAERKELVCRKTVSISCQMVFRSQQCAVRSDGCKCEGRSSKGKFFVLNFNSKLELLANEADVDGS